MKLSKNLFFSLLMLFSIGAAAQSMVSPIIADYGKIWDIPGTRKPDTAITYKIVIDLKTDSYDPSKINRGLDNVARMLNLHGAGGIRVENIKAVVAIHGNATGITMDNQAYRNRHGTDNPNLGLFRQLREAGVELYVCGQSLIGRGFDQKQVNPDVTIALSMLTIVAEYQMKGYGLLVFN